MVIIGGPVVLVGAVTRRGEGIAIGFRIGAETVKRLLLVGGVVSRLQVVDDRIQLRRVHRVGRIPQGSEDEGDFGEGEADFDLVHGDKSKKKSVQVKKKVKEKKGRSERPRIDKGREAIPSGVNLVVDGIDHVEPSVKLGAVSVGQAGIIFGSGGGEGVDQVHAKQNETFFGAVNFFLRFFFSIFFLFFS